jgi:exodeoxyribonuclease V beta subunit
MEFALPVSAPDGSAVTPQRLGDVFRRMPSPAVPADYPARVGGLRFEPIAGFVRGYVDLVFESQGRWYLVDYKSSSLGPGVEHYARQGLAAVMAEHHYFLQYHLYAVAVHRMLCLRTLDYDYDRDFGGVFYLFLRGITPQHAPEHGVFFDRPPRSTLLALSALFGPASEGDS